MLTEHAKTFHNITNLNSVERDFSSEALEFRTA